MATGTEGTSTDGTAPQASTFADEIGAMFGDVSTVYDESPETETHQDAGEPPASASAPTSDTPAPGPEGAPSAEHAGAPPAVAAPAAPDDDPLDGATPFPYTVDGESRTFDGITVLKSGGAIIAADALPKLQQRLSERDHLFDQGRKDFQRYADLERLTAWPKRDAQGNVTDITGPDAIWEMRATGAQAMAAVRVVNDFLKDPAKFATLVGVDAENNIVVNPAGLDSFRDKIGLASRDAVDGLRQRFGELSKPTAPAETPIADVAAPTVEQYITQYSIQGLTPEDKTFLAGQLPRYLTQHNGQRAVDPAFLDVMKDRAALRQSTAASASAATTAAQENARRLAAASLGKRPLAPVVPARPVPKPTLDQDALWAQLERASGA